MGRPMATSQDFVNWVCGPDLDPHFLAYLLRVSRVYIRSLSSGAIHQTVYMPTVKSFFVRVPAIGERVPAIAKQREIAKFLNEHLSTVERARQAAEQELAAVRALPAALLRRAFSGGSFERILVFAPRL